MEIIHDKKNKSFILPLDNGLKANVDYILENETSMKLVHSEVPISLRGEGIGKELVLKTFDKLTNEGFEATAVCSYIRAVAKRHSKWSKIIN